MGEMVSITRLFQSFNILVAPCSSMFCLILWPPDPITYSPSSVLYGGGISSLDGLVMLYSMQFRVLLVLAPRSCWWLLAILSSRTTVAFPDTLLQLFGHQTVLLPENICLQIQEFAFPFVEFHCIPVDLFLYIIPLNGNIVGLSVSSPVLYHLQSCWLVPYPGHSSRYLIVFIPLSSPDIILSPHSWWLGSDWTLCHWSQPFESSSSGIT